MKTCRFPDCNKQISDQTTNGVCFEHRHKAPWCGCFSCQRRYPGSGRESRVAFDQDKRFAEVGGFDSDGQPLANFITLRKEPWL